ncbi:hypothetical protein K6Q96_22730 [Grimontia kaedaensis]|uniref:Uncharacterized protein n=1 Tax=Grimontia kaedaensis TaxID=2872157 RepID=A0ABY4WZZ6_9GAMM|nr:hypothetical protein [Grimontia kaedaensis]USH04542.1 hypothetical protein K6Q96_22730 [Grimontia kaedaensis]
MYFWNIEALKNNIKQGVFSEKDRFSYVLIYIVLGLFGTSFGAYFPMESSNLWDKVDDFGLLVITIVGTFFAYKANGGDKGTDFLGRYFSINFVVSLRLLPWLIPMLVGLGIYYSYAFPLEEDIVTTPFEVILFQAWIALIYIRMCKHMGDLNEIK